MCLLEIHHRPALRVFLLLSRVAIITYKYCPHLDFHLYLSDLNVPVVAALFVCFDIGAVFRLQYNRNATDSFALLLSPALYRILPLRSHFCQT